MNSIVEVLVLLLLLDLCLAQDPEPKIVGGWEADIRNIPFFVLLENEDDNSLVKPGEDHETCGSTIIHPQWLLTAAHCTWNYFTNSRTRYPFWLIMGVDEKMAFYSHAQTFTCAIPISRGSI